MVSGETLGSDLYGDNERVVTNDKLCKLSFSVFKTDCETMELSYTKEHFDATDSSQIHHEGKYDETDNVEDVCYFSIHMYILCYS